MRKHVYNNFLYSADTPWTMRHARTQSCTKLNALTVLFETYVILMEIQYDVSNTFNMILCEVDYHQMTTIHCL